MSTAQDVLAAVFAAELLVQQARDKLRAALGESILTREAERLHIMLHNEARRAKQRLEQALADHAAGKS
jgi:hypothetical protein